MKRHGPRPRAVGTITVSMSRKINLGNYESAECFASLQGLPPDATVEDMRRLLDVGKVAWDEVRDSLSQQVARTKRSRGVPDYDEPVTA